MGRVPVFLQAVPRTAGRVSDFYGLRREQWGGFQIFTGCAANSGAGFRFLRAAPRTAGRVPVFLQAAPQTAGQALHNRILRRVDQRFSPAFFKRRRVKAGAKAPCGLWLPPRAAPFSPGRSPHKSAARRPQDTSVQAQGLASAGNVTDAVRLARFLQASRLPAFLKKSLGKKL